ncbi:MAG: zinc ribbon domain-containing protein [Acidobacteria bacterium]|nr:zinc ribbon domain-containing protein [Acidobacteriota bacterium]
MPLFEYACRGCGHRFEYLTREGRTPSCPACAGRDLEKLHSAFAVNAQGGGREAGRPAAGPCGQCGDPRGPGACSMN